MNKKMTVWVFCLLIVGFITGIKYGCLFKNMFGTECPSCGLSHAWLAFLAGDVKAACSYHPMFWFPPLALLYCCTPNSIVSKRFDFTLLAVLVILYFFIYFVKIYE